MTDTNETTPQEDYPVLDEHGEPWTGSAAGFVAILFIVLVALTALAAIVVPVLKLTLDNLF